MMRTAVAMRTLLGGFASIGSRAYFRPERHVAVYLNCCLRRFMAIKLGRKKKPT
jgi:hypothetical protein